MTKHDILDLLTNDEISYAIKALRAALPNDNTILNIAGQWNRLVKDKNAGTISSEYATLTGNQIRNALIELTNRLPEGTKVDIVFDPPVGGTTSGGATQKKGPVVFLSYNHGDMEQAHKVKNFLNAKGIQVTIDSEAMQAGEDIAAFINKCIREADITLSLVSNKSLLSAWVGMESVNTLVGEKIADKRLIAVVIDSSFYDRGFVDTAFTTIEERMDELKKLMLARLEKDRGIEDLQSERTRNKNLLNDLPEIVANLRARLNIDISGDKFQQGMEKVAQSIINK